MKTKTKTAPKTASNGSAALTVQTVAIDKVIPYSRNPRKNEGAVAKVAASIREFGFRQPIVVDEAMTVIAGHTRLMAARQLGMGTVPVHVAAGLSAAQVKAYRIADNRVAEEAEWDEAMLGLELDDLRELDFDLSLTGFDEAEIASLGGSGLLEGANPDAVPEVPDEPTSREGDLILLGRHRLLCGNATKPEHVDRLLDGASPQMVYTDPPYGQSLVQDSMVGADFGVAKKGKYQPIAGDGDTQTAIDAYSLVATLGIPQLIFWGGNRYAPALPASPCWLVWDKRGDSGIENTFADCEFAWTNMTGQSRIYRQLWNGMIREGERGARVHPTQKPVALAEWCFEKYGRAQDTVLDLFAGSGSTIIAAETKGRTALLMELSPAYCDVIVARWEKATGGKAVRQTGTG